MALGFRFIRALGGILGSGIFFDLVQLQHGNRPFDTWGLTLQTTSGFPKMSMAYLIGFFLTKGVLLFGDL